MRRLMLLCGTFFVLVQFHRSAGGVLANWLDAAGHPPVAVASVVGALFLASALVQLPYGLLFDRFGPRATLGAMGLLAVAGMALFAFSDSASGMATGRFLIGVGHGGVIAGIYLLAMAWAPPERLATVTAAVVAIAGGLGGALATAPLALGLGGLGFERTFGLVALATLAATALFYATVRDAPPGSAAAARVPESFGQSLRGLWEVATDRSLWPLFAMGTCFSAPFMTIGGLWVGPYLREVHGLDQAASAWVILAMVVALHAGTLAYGPMDRWLNSRKRVILGGVAVNVVLLGALAAAPAAPLGLVVVLLTAFAFFSPFFVVLAAHSRGFVPFHRAGRAIACVNLMGLTSVFALQGGTAALVEAAAGTDPALGYRLVFAAVAAVLVIAAALYSRARDVPPRPAPAAGE